VGYNEASKSYMIFISTQRKTVVRRNVKFEENLASRKSHELPLVVEDEEQEASKGEQRLKDSISRIQPLGGEEELVPSIFVMRPRWFKKTLKDAQKHVEAPRSTVRESMPPKKFPNFMALSNNVIEEEIDHHFYQNAMV
jgi:hypothetical protein